MWRKVGWEGEKLLSKERSEKGGGLFCWQRSDKGVVAGRKGGGRGKGMCMKGEVQRGVVWVGRESGVAVWLGKALH